MMIATDRAISGRSPSGSGRTRRRLRIRERSFRRSDLHDLGFFVLQQIVDLPDVLVGELLHSRLRRALVVVADVAVPHALLEMLDRVAPHVSNGDPSLLRHM